MKESFEYKPTPQEQTPPPQAEARLTPEQISEKRGKVLQTLEKARLLPPDWKSGAGKNRDEMIAALEGSLEELDTLESNLQNEPEAPVAVAERPAPQRTERKKMTPPPLGKSRGDTSAIQPRGSVYQYRQCSRSNLPATGRKPRMESGSRQSVRIGRQEVF